MLQAKWLLTAHVFCSNSGSLTGCVGQLVRQAHTLCLTQLTTGVPAVGSAAVHAAVLLASAEVAGSRLCQGVADFPRFRAVA